MLITSSYSPLVEYIAGNELMWGNDWYNTVNNGNKLFHCGSKTV